MGEADDPSYGSQAVVRCRGGRAGRLCSGLRGGPRDLYVDRDDTEVGTTLIEGNWNAATQEQDWTIEPQPIADSYFLEGKPAWFGSLAWPPVDPANPVTDDPTIIPAGYRYVNGTDP